jgi:ATP adenylyltransferase/5',5'''-P-1,P-4-tetraphosphate phosphorylase II
MTNQNTSDLATQSHDLLRQQQPEWKLLRDNIAALALVQVRSVDMGGFALKIQFNPARIASTGAKIDPKTIRERKCFLCDQNRPPEQRALAFDDDYKILCNPFPIFPEHFTIPHREHRPQMIAGVFGDLLDLARALAPRYTVIYNGPRAGASAPDHLHFQAGDRGWMPIEAEAERLAERIIAKSKGLRVSASTSIRPFVLIESNDRGALVDAFETIYRNLANIAPDPDEPSMNVIAWFDDGRGYRVILLPRAKHRPSFYFAEGDEKILLSPGTVDLGGVCIVPLEPDYRKITRAHLEQMLREVMLAPDPFGRLCDALEATLG